jgi:thymidylate synthase ThyX
MNVTVKKITDWDLVYEMALYTQGKKPTKLIPSEEWKRKTIKASHSILRCMQFMVYIEDVPNFVHNHLVRHVTLQPFIRTMREDLTGVSSDEITRNTHNNGCYMMNAQTLMSVANQRLCYKASKETREVMEQIVKRVSEIEPMLAQFLVPNCIKVGYCPEYKSCGFKFEKKREEYIKLIKGEE